MQELEADVRGAGKAQAKLTKAQQVYSSLSRFYVYLSIYLYVVRLLLDIYINIDG